MQKIYIEKSTNKVSQIIKDYYEDFETYGGDAFGDTYYMVEIKNKEDELENHFFTYDPITKTFESTGEVAEEVVIEDRRAEMRDLQAENEQLKSEMADLKAELDEIKNLIKNLK